MATNVSASHGRAGDVSKNTPMMVSAKAIRVGAQLRKMIEKITKLDESKQLFQVIGAGANFSYAQLANKPIVNRIAGLSDEETATFAALVYAFFVEVARSRTQNSSKTSFSDELREAKFPAPVIEFISDAVFDYSQNSASLYTIVPQNAVNRLHRFTWRLDVIITSHLGKKILEPIFLVRCLTTTGKDVIFEIPVAHFHRLRVTISTILNQMNGLMSRKVLNS
ncbi:COMM domain-containing protein 5-like [Paramacrobiotus metropolitanus]|uniref:COMM domain-containing protein 5-like n=1 Tax=Paramacrobiotus metropolitanus TaxID=2943436 RepID=UPI0024464DA1|nr:COMM domain-containing protein 5-like [Paramacrobiotus metropolitanus]XP_055333314.1 COMM domain-containing protein 5-like [Paramacrobiotus metropolitanus]XP_055333315.1 COMM domain-containing protein 5-like [Paramacrobiotus metropolitanus]XP_055333317.1 COMM domain-containing protein 5-like [Paramacrobiotus metropolitanus]